MQVEFAFPADAAIVTADGKISVLGAGIEDYRPPSYPATLASVSFVAKLRIHPSECEREHTLEIELWDPNGARIGQQIQAQFTPTRYAPDPARSVSLPLVLNFQQLAIPSPGVYEFHVIVDGTHLKQVGIHFHLPQQAIAGLPPG